MRKPFSADILEASTAFRSPHPCPPLIGNVVLNSVEVGHVSGQQRAADLSFTGQGGEYLS